MRKGSLLIPTELIYIEAQDRVEHAGMDPSMAEKPAIYEVEGMQFFPGSVLPQNLVYQVTLFMGKSRAKEVHIGGVAVGHVMVAHEMDPFWGLQGLLEPSGGLSGTFLSLIKTVEIISQKNGKVWLFFCDTLLYPVHFIM
jgi:hypothetical protein